MVYVYVIICKQLRLSAKIAVLKIIETCKKKLAKESTELVKIKTSKLKLFRKMHSVTATSIAFLRVAIFKYWSTYPKTKM